MGDIARCVITEDAVRRAWSDHGGGDLDQRTLDRLMEQASLIEGAMEDAGVSMAMVLVSDW